MTTIRRTSTVISWLWIIRPMSAKIDDAGATAERLAEERG
jgi:hypothetical protein